MERQSMPLEIPLMTGLFVLIRILHHSRLGGPEWTRSVPVFSSEKFSSDLNLFARVGRGCKTLANIPIFMNKINFVRVGERD
jgi:hypothetical protein